MQLRVKPKVAFVWPPHLVISQAKKSYSYDEQQLRELMHRLRQFDRNGVVPILSLNHLARMTGTNRTFLCSVVGRNESKFLPYRDFRTKKKSGGLRLIRDPIGALKRVQRWILRHVLDARALSNHCYGVSKDRNSVACARQHCGSRWLLNLDIRDFFASFTEPGVYQFFLSLGYAPLVSFELTRLVTYPTKGTRDSSELDLKDKYPMIPAYWHKSIGSLPQGAPTSSRLANLLMSSLDNEIACAAHALGWHYTRYVDDISLSTSRLNITREDVRKLYKRIRLKLPPRLEFNSRKTSVSSPGARKIVMGLLVDGDRPRLTRRYRNNVEIHLHYSEKNGVAMQAKARKFRSPVLFLDHLRGKVSYARQVDPELAERWGTRLSALRQSFVSS